MDLKGILSCEELSRNDERFHCGQKEEWKVNGQLAEGTVAESVRTILAETACPFECQAKATSRINVFPAHH